ncbi:ribonuclease H-like protein [Byssothecium circinans]|uniref:Ribonuclease H-like protein n=1 Tax=Byssothecium circinans TaxID=147558 RepID=A0A6A5U5W8_9PLEO|nr:ribonuclease H-like protein [Byssothecium circinans]
MGITHNVLSQLTKSSRPTVKALQSLLQAVGGATSGKKDVLERRVLKACLSIDGHQHQWARKRAKVLSIDMGIRNLAYCVTEVEKSSPTSSTMKMSILAWRRLDLTEETSTDSNQEENGDDQEKDPYSPKNLSATANSLVKNLLGYEPDVVLIERQRWRSSGSSAIQQWTVRVNSLEAMLWALFTNTYRTQEVSARRYMLKDIRSMDPKRVGTYWLDGLETYDPPKVVKKRTKKSDSDVEEEDNEIDSNSTKTLSRGKAEKKAKINLLRTWLDSKTPSTALSAYSNNDEAVIPRPRISFHFAPSHPQSIDDPIIARDTLLWATDPPAKRAKREKALTSRKKVDDITDCFLQAAAYVAWEEGLVQLRKKTKEFHGEILEELKARSDGVAGDGERVEERVEEGGTLSREKEDHFMMSAISITISQGPPSLMFSALFPYKQNLSAVLASDCAVCKAGRARQSCKHI